MNQFQPVKIYNARHDKLFPGFAPADPKLNQLPELLFSEAETQYELQINWEGMS